MSNYVHVNPGRRLALLIAGAILVAGLLAPSGAMQTESAHAKYSAGDAFLDILTGGAWTPAKAIRRGSRDPESGNGKAGTTTTVEKGPNGAERTTTTTTDKSGDVVSVSVECNDEADKQENEQQGGTHLPGTWGPSAFGYEGPSLKASAVKRYRRLGYTVQQLTGSQLVLLAASLRPTVIGLEPSQKLELIAAKISSKQYLVISKIAW